MQENSRCKGGKLQLSWEKKIKNECLLKLNGDSSMLFYPLACILLVPIQQVLFMVWVFASALLQLLVVFGEGQWERPSALWCLVHAQTQTGALNPLNGSVWAWDGARRHGTVPCSASPFSITSEHTLQSDVQSGRRCLLAPCYRCRLVRREFGVTARNVEVSWT